MQTYKIIAKTAASEWALENNLWPDTDILKTAIKVRKEPEKYKNDEAVLDWSETLGKHIQRFADVLEHEIYFAK